MLDATATRPSWRSVATAAVLGVLVLVVAAGGAPAVAGDAAATDTTDDVVLEADATLDVTPDEPDSAAVHEWTLTGVETGDEEIEEITVAYDGASLDGLDSDDVTVAFPRDGEDEPTEISVNNDEYDGEQATFDLSGIFNTDIDGPVTVTIDGVENPPTGTHEATMILHGEDGTDVNATTEFTVGNGVSGIVHADDGTALGNAEVVLRGTDGTFVEVVETDADGSYATGELPEETSALVADAEGYATSEPVGIEDADDGSVDLVLSTPSNGTLAGSVTDAAGEPLPEGTYVRFTADEAAFGPDRTVRLGADGSYELGGLPTGEYTLTALSPGYDTSDPGTVTIDDEPATQTFTLQESETAALVGTATDADGEPLPEGTFVRFTADDEAFGPAKTVQLDADGEFSLTGLDPGEYTLTADSAAYESSDPTTVDLTDGAVETETFALAEPASVEIDALRVNGVPRADATLTVTATVTNVGDVATTEQLVYRMDGVVADEQMVSIDAGATTRTTFAVTPDEPGLATHGVSADGDRLVADVTISDSGGPPASVPASSSNAAPVRP